MKGKRTTVTPKMITKSREANPMTMTAMPHCGINGSWANGPESLVMLTTKKIEEDVRHY